MTDQQQPQRDIIKPHSYDGIQEYDNQLPRWWLALFAGSVIWAILYIAYYHFGLFGGGLVGPERLAVQLAREQAKLDAMDSGPLTEEEMIAIYTDPTQANRIANGEKLWGSKACGSCHTNEGWGNVGPNMRDEYWLHGSQFTDIINTITKGSPNGQMQPQTDKLSRRQIQDVTLYLVHLNQQTPKNDDGTTTEGKKPDLERAERAPFTF